MKLNDEESDILAGKAGPVPQQALHHQIKVGKFFGAENMVAVTQAHLMADTESLGEAGVRWLEGLAAITDGQRRVRIPTITDPRGTDFAKADWLGQTSAMLSLERRAISAFEALGVAMTNTCINYQTIQAPTRNEHVAFGDTGVVIYSNSICGARSNFEGGPSALAAGLTGRTPRYGFHLPEMRRATLRIEMEFTPTSLNGWGALGGVIGRIAGNYWAVPVIEGIEGAPKSDQLKHFGASMASFGSIALFYLAGLTPGAGKLTARAGQGMQASGHQQCKAGQYIGRLRLSADARVDGGMCGCRRQRKIGPNMSNKIFYARHAMGSTVRGPALVANDGFSARYDLDRINGIFCRPSHKLAGQSYIGKILVLDTAKGGVATAWMLHEMKSRGIVPLALIFNSVNPILAQGAALGDLSMLAGFDEDIAAAVPDGAEVEVNPQGGVLTVVG